MQNIGVGIIGYGLAGQVFHAPLIHAVQGYDIRKIVTSSNREKALADFPDAQIVASADEVMHDPEIQLVVVATPNTSHLPLAKQALAAGKHVVVDKPFTNTAQEADELIALAKEKNQLLSVFQNRRWDNDFLTLQACLKSGILGEIYTYEAHYDRFRPDVNHKWREQDLPGSGMLYDLGAHLIDQALFLFGPPQTIYADLLKQRPDSDVIDYFHLLLNYDKLRVILHSGIIVKTPGPRFQVHGTKGSFIKYGLDSQEATLKVGGRPGDSGWGADKPEFYAEVTTEINNLTLTSRMETLPGSYQSYYALLLAAIRDQQPLPVAAEAGRDVIKVIEVAMQSSQEKREIAF